MTDLSQLFDETYGTDGDYSRTIWYGYIEGELDETLANRLVSLIQQDLTIKQENSASATHWVFYGDKTFDDALGEKTRSSLLVRLKDEEFVVTYSLGDFAFVMSYDEWEAFRHLMLERLTV